MTTTTFSSRYNAQRSARRSLGPTAREGVDFQVEQTTAGFTWQAIDRAAAEAALRAATAERVAAEQAAEQAAYEDMCRRGAAEIEAARAANRATEQDAKAKVRARLAAATAAKAEKVEAKAAAKADGVRPGTKRAKILTAMRREQGVTLAEMTEIFPKCNHLTAIPANLTKISRGDLVVFLREDGEKAWRWFATSDEADAFAAVARLAPPARGGKRTGTGGKAT